MIWFECFCSLLWFVGLFMFLVACFGIAYLMLYFLCFWTCTDFADLLAVLLVMGIVNCLFRLCAFSLVWFE